MKKIVLAIIIVFIVIIGCATNKTKNSNQKLHADSIKVTSSDTIKYCQELTNNFYKDFDIFIPKYYTVYDSLAIDINFDELIDTIVILEPVSIVDPKFYDCRSKENENRLLVEIINLGDHSTIRNIYRNLISNRGGVMSPYTGISKTKSGFEIEHQSGNRYSWVYKIQLEVKSDSIMLHKIIKTCMLEGYERTEEYLLNMSANTININDTIQNDCNCENAWHYLQDSLNIE